MFYPQTTMPLRSLVYSCYDNHRPVHSFPTRRSSDLHVAHRLGGPSREAVQPRRRCPATAEDRKSTRLNSSHPVISYAVFCLKKTETIRGNFPNTSSVYSRDVFELINCIERSSS